MRKLLLALPLAAGLAIGSDTRRSRRPPRRPAATPNQPPNEQVIEPAVPRRDVRVPKIPSNDFIVGAFLGTYSSRTSARASSTACASGYHITEDFFVEGVYGTTKVSDENFRQILPGGVFPQNEETLSYYNLSVGYNILPGEVFFGSKYAKASALYLIAGVGSTKFLDQSNADRSTSASATACS